MTKWSVELSEYDIEFQPWPAMKSQVFGDFLIELPQTPGDQIGTNTKESWTLYVDGSSSSRGSGIGIRLVSPAGEILEQSFRLRFPATNNVAEYEA